MIKYNSVQNKYIYKKEDIENVLDTLQNTNFYNMDNCTKENISNVIDSIENFMSNIEIVPETVELERHETEEEAREYFGSEFIAKFDKLLTILDKEDTMVALHGTNPDVCPNICDEGLRYMKPSLSSTAVTQSMAYGQEDMHYEKYENLLNWGHRNYKGLVILAIPYECFYKEGLWNHYQDSKGAVFYGVQDYKIDPDFIVGYIDVNNKEIVINHKYNRQHNYDGYVSDNELFREQPDMDNDKIRQWLIESSKMLDKEKFDFKENYEYTVEEREADPSKLPENIESLIGIFNSINNKFDGISEDRYNYFKKQLKQDGFDNIIKSLPLLKTNEQVKK